MFHIVCLFNSCAWVKTLQLSKSTHPNLWLSYLQRIRLITLSDLLLIYIWWLYCVWMFNSSNEARGMKAVRNSLLALTLETIRRKAAQDAVWMFILSFFVPSLLFGLNKKELSTKRGEVSKKTVAWVKILHLACVWKLNFLGPATWQSVLGCEFQVSLDGW